MAKGVNSMSTPQHIDSPEGSGTQIRSKSWIGLVVAWLVFWVLLVTIAVHEFVRTENTGLWKPFVWEGSSCVVASALVFVQWRRIHSLDRLLGQPVRWFLAAVAILPITAPVFVTAVFGIRHAIYALVDVQYRHAPWADVYRYEMLKFSIFFLLFAAVFFGVRSYSALSATRVRLEKQRSLAQQAQLLQLTQQLEPHFLFNALNAIAATIHTDAELADTLLIKLAALLRAATDLTRSPDTSLSEELALVQGYADIMCQRFGDRVSLWYSIGPETVGCRVPTLVLQPLLENAFHHGVERRKDRTNVWVRSYCKDASLVIEVENESNCSDFPKTFGVGLSNVKQRLENQYGSSGKVSLAATESGTVLARLEMPCES